ncbi:N-alpha-acetyltransferase 60-like [Onychomys torridus]|uniref:N-alpha-acetyltransferase 60-like n=1 Tax=Onychomys torridus TaxID=38674 RepID=UPI00167F9C3A|nr:N-alpha-acetyltransferase 60-like [Onychomys torridus]
MTEVVPSSALSEVSLRLLCHDDIDTVKHLCVNWFPIEYPDSWYPDITSTKKFFSLAATYRGAFVEMIVAEIKNRSKIHKEDGDILASSFSVDTQVAYILSLGVVKEFRKHGIGPLQSHQAWCYAGSGEECMPGLQQALLPASGNFSLHLEPLSCLHALAPSQWPGRCWLHSLEKGFSSASCSFIFPTEWTELCCEKNMDIFDTKDIGTLE